MNKAVSVTAAQAIAETPTREEQPKGMAGLFKSTMVVIRKDLRLEWRGRARINATVFFALLTLLIFSFAIGPNHKMLAVTAPGFMWLGIMLASTLSLSESMRIERENAALEGLRLLGLNPRALFYGKTLVNTLLLISLSLVMVPIAMALYGSELTLGFWPLLVVLTLGCMAISAPGTLYAAMASHAKSRDVLLPLLLFPVLVPGLLAAVKATALVMQGDPMGQLVDWSKLLGAFVIIYWILGGVVFGRVIEE